MAGVRRAKAIPTIYDVASRAGVAIASVSRVLNGQGSPKAETRKPVLHDQMLSKVEIARLADVVPIVTLAGNPSSASINVRCDNGSGMRALIHHLVTDHGYRNLAYLSGGADSPDNLARARVFETEAIA